jgi:penicillin amidase
LRFLLVLLLLAAGVSAAGWLSLRASLPQYDGVAKSTALSDRVVVERDALGTATIRATSRRDADWALGYVHAQERFFQMDLMRRRAAGELAELFGPVALPADRVARVHRMRARMVAELATLPADQRAALDAYRDGVNAGIAALSARPFPYLLTRTKPVPWRDEDSLLVVAAMAFTLNDSENARELAFSKMHAALPASAYRFLTAGGGDWDAPLTGAALQWPDPPSAAELDLNTLPPALLRAGGTRLAAASAASDVRVVGSNGLAVAGALTGGAALIANDTHLDLGVPCLWFRTRLVYPSARHAGATSDTNGVSLPGLPAIALGSNGRIAWGFTNSYVDTADWVRVTRDGDRYRDASGEWKAIGKHAETIRVRGAPDATLAVEDTEWGPIAATDADGTPLALEWSAQQPGAIDLTLRAMADADTVDEAVAVANVSGIPPQNIIVGDATGRIEWSIAGRIPRRIGGYDAALPFDATKRGTGWDGWLDPADVPRVADPVSQRLWSGNQRPVGGDAAARLGDGGYDIGARARQLRDDLAAREHFAPRDLLAIQLDDRALFLARWKDLLDRTLERAPAGALVDAMKRGLADWDGQASIGSVSYRLVAAWHGEVVETVLDGFAAKVRERFPDFELPKLLQSDQAIWTLVTMQPAHLLIPGYSDWNDLLLRSAERVGRALDAAPGGIAARTWGERNTTHIVHPLSRGLPSFVARFLDMPAEPLPGDRDIPRVQDPAFGAAIRFGVAPGDEADGYLTIAGGQSGHPLSPYYGAGHEDWANGAATPFLPGPAQHTLTLLAR